MEHYLMFLTVAATTVMSPGPGVLLTLTNALHHGWRDTLAGVLGVASGAVVVAALSATSLGVLLATSPMAYTALRYLGAAYLVYLGIRLWRAPPFRFDAAASQAGNARRRYLEGLSLQFSNPKAIFFFLSVFPQFIRPEADHDRQFALLVCSYGALVVAIHVLYAAFAQRARKWLSSASGARVLQRVSGTLFFGFAAMLL